MADDDNRSRQHFVHRVKYSTRERLVGTFVFGGLLALALLAVHSSTAQYFRQKADFYVYVDNAAGLHEDTPVRISGVDVGEIADLDFSHDHRIYVKFFVYQQFHSLIRADSVARINRLDLLGTAALEISAGSLEAPEVAAGAFLPVEKTLALDELVGGLARLIGDSDEASLNQIAEDLGNLSQQVQSIVAQISSGRGAVGTLIFDEEFGNSFRNLGPILDETQGAIGNLRDTVTQMPEMVGQITSAVTEINKAMTVMNREMTQFPDMMVHMNLIMEEMTRVLEGMQRVWPLSSAVPPKKEHQMIDTRPADE